MNKTQIRIFIDISGGYPTYRRPWHIQLESIIYYVNSKQNKIIKV